MKLTSAQVERTMSQFEVQALPDNHPAVPELNELFGEHTFLLDSNGLNILEPADGVPRGAVQTARVINLANWSGDNSHQAGAARAAADRRHRGIGSVQTLIGVVPGCRGN